METGEITLRMTEHLDAIEAQRKEPPSRVQQQGTDSGRPDATTHLTGHLQQLNLQVRRHQQVDQDTSQDFATLTSTLSEAAERRKASVQSLSSACQQPASPYTNLRHLESEINKSRIELEELMASVPT